MRPKRRGGRGLLWVSNSGLAAAPPPPPDEKEHQPRWPRCKCPKPPGPMSQKYGGCPKSCKQGNQETLLLVAQYGRLPCNTADGRNPAPFRSGIIRFPGKYRPAGNPPLLVMQNRCETRPPGHAPRPRLAAAGGAAHHLRSEGQGTPPKVSKKPRRVRAVWKEGLTRTSAHPESCAIDLGGIAIDLWGCGFAQFS